MHRAYCRPPAVHVSTMQNTVFQTATTAVSVVVPATAPEDMEESVNVLPVDYNENDAIYSLNDASFTVSVKESVSWPELAVKCGCVLYQPARLTKTGKQIAAFLQSGTRNKLINRADRLCISYAHFKRKSKPLKAFLTSK